MQTSNNISNAATIGHKHPALDKSWAHFGRPVGRNILARTQKFLDWRDARMNADVWSYCRTFEAPPGPVTTIRKDDGSVVSGLNFGNTDYMGLAVHPAVAEAASRALRQFGVHVPSTGILQGSSSVSRGLETALSELLGCEHVVLFPTGWTAGFGAIVGLVRPYDHVVLDNRAHACLQAGAEHATVNVRHHEHLDANDLRRHLSEIRATDSRNGILVVSEGLFSMDSDVPDLVRIQDVAREFDAVLLVDVSHDVGCSGPRGSGEIGKQNLLGKVDLVMGALSKNLCAPGGFVATASRAVKHYLRAFATPHVFSSAMSPVQAAAASEAIRIVRSEEGDALRARLNHNVEVMRKCLGSKGLPVIGSPSPITPIVVGAEAVARVSGSLACNRGVFLNVVEFPAVPMGEARLRMLVMASHSEEQIATAVQTVAASVDDAQGLLQQREVNFGIGDRSIATEQAH